MSALPVRSRPSLSRPLETTELDSSISKAVSRHQGLPDWDSCKWQLTKCIVQPEGASSVAMYFHFLCPSNVRRMFVIKAHNTVHERRGAEWKVFFEVSRRASLGV